ncbi:alpha/beta fold hydrolase [Streptomyces microflavus]|uniref:alpha/beta fold hydrolase n=1 Tax=Streptomyces microflavus TaxID=1919 RepID=UPI0036A060A4
MVGPVSGRWAWRSTGGCAARSRCGGRASRGSRPPSPHGRRSPLEAIAEGTGSDREAVAHFGADGAFEPEDTRAALARFESPVLLLADESELNSPPRAVAQCAELFPGAALVEQPGAGHCPWIDDPDRFVATASAFLGQAQFLSLKILHARPLCSV